MSLLPVVLPLMVAAQVYDERYQEYAKRHASTLDSKAQERGQQMACGLCNVVLMGIKGKYDKHKGAAPHEKFNEEDGLKQFEQFCHTFAPTVAKKMKSHPEDERGQGLTAGLFPSAFFWVDAPGC
jgi:hypothetical protein